MHTYDVKSGFTFSFHDMRERSVQSIYMLSELRVRMYAYFQHTHTQKQADFSKNQSMQIAD
jgi:hypothetical protein